MSSERPPESRRWGGYFAALGALLVASLAALATFNFVMDPYNVWGHPQGAYKPWLLTYGPPELAARLRRPATIIIGSSRVEAGFASDSAAARAWGPTLVDAVEHPYFTYQEELLTAAIAGGRLRHALVEIDPRELLACQQERRGPTLPQAMGRVLLLPAAGPSLRMLGVNLRARFGHPPARPYRLASGLLVMPQLGPAAVAGTIARAPAIAFADPPGWRCDPPYSGRSLARLDRLDALAARGHVQLIFFLGPWRQELLHSVWREGDWPRLETIRRDLAAFAARSGAPVWDFTTTELQSGEPTGERDFYDVTHFKPALGERVLGAIEAGQEGMGWRLSPTGLEARLAADRARVASLAGGA